MHRLVTISRHVSSLIDAGLCGPVCRASSLQTATCAGLTYQDLQEAQAQLWLQRIRLLCGQMDATFCRFTSRQLHFSINF